MSGYPKLKKGWCKPSAPSPSPPCFLWRKGKGGMQKLIVASTSRISAPTSAVTVASFRTWRGSQPIVAKEPILATITLAFSSGKYSKLAEREGFEPSIRYERIHAFQACSFDRSDTSPIHLESRKGKLD